MDRNSDLPHKTKERGEYFQRIVDEVFTLSLPRERFEARRAAEGPWGDLLPKRGNPQNCPGSGLELKALYEWFKENQTPHRAFCPICGREVPLCRFSRDGKRVSLKAHHAPVV